MDRITRRQALQGLLLAGGALSGCGWPLLAQLFGAELFGAKQPSSSLFRGEGSFGEADRLLGAVPFADEPHPVMERVLGRELDGRLFTDLSVLNPDAGVTPTDKFYLRTCASRLLPGADTWTLRLPGRGEDSVEISLSDLKRMEAPCGLHVMECSGNGAFAHFGMLSVADWTGISLAGLLDQARGKSKARGVLISGFDRYQGRSQTSLPGASWIFAFDELVSARAFLATSMNGQPLTRNHGAPVRLLIPGWYGCCCIKWVNEISLVDDDAMATSQMREFASRTHQPGIPDLACDYTPAVIDPAAVPIRVEKWLAAGKIEYRVVGILWGASRPVGGLEIQFNPQQPFVDIEHFSPTQEDAFSFWSHTWRPAAPGRYTIRLRLKDRSVRTRRLDMGFYARSVVIDEV